MLLYLRRTQFHLFWVHIWQCLGQSILRLGCSKTKCLPPRQQLETHEQFCHMFCVDRAGVNEGGTWVWTEHCPFSPRPGGCLMKSTIKVWGSEAILQGFGPPRSSHGPWVSLRVPRLAMPHAPNPLSSSEKEGRKCLWKEERAQGSLTSSTELYSHFLSSSLSFLSSVPHSHYHSRCLAKSFLQKVFSPLILLALLPTPTPKTEGFSLRRPSYSSFCFASICLKVFSPHVLLNHFWALIGGLN